jgi:hypothetical protein
MIRLGTALKSAEHPYHRCIVLSDPQANGGQVVLVRVTTDDGTWPDRDCLLGPVDWRELEHASTVAYSTCKFGPAVSTLEQAVQKGLFKEVGSPPPSLLRRMMKPHAFRQECRRARESGWQTSPPFGELIFHNAAFNGGNAWVAPIESTTGFTGPSRLRHNG